MVSDIKGLDTRQTTGPRQTPGPIHGLRILWVLLAYALVTIGLMYAMPSYALVLAVVLVACAVVEIRGGLVRDFCRPVDTRGHASRHAHHRGTARISGWVGDALYARCRRSDPNFGHAAESPEIARPISAGSGFESLMAYNLAGQATSPA